MIDFERTRLEKYSTSLYSYEGMDVLHQILGKKKSVIVTSTLARNDQINNLPRECHTKSITSNEEANFIMMRSEKFHSMEDKFQLVSVQDIQHSAFVIPLKYDSNKEIYLSGKAEYIFVLASMSQWSNLFLDYTDKKLMDKPKERCDNDIDSSDEYYPFET